MSLKAYIVELPEETVRSVARRTHERYLAQVRAEGRFDASRPTHKDWEALSEDDRSRNYAQVRAYPGHLAVAGLGIVVTEESADPVPLPEAMVERLAQLEHNRWAENQIARDPRHSDVVHWIDLDEQTRDLDREPVRGMVGLLGEAGFSVVVAEDV